MRSWKRLTALFTKLSAAAGQVCELDGGLAAACAAVCHRRPLPLCLRGATVNFFSGPRRGR